MKFLLTRNVPGSLPLLHPTPSSFVFLFVTNSWFSPETWPNSHPTALVTQYALRGMQNKYAHKTSTRQAHLWEWVSCLWSTRSFPKHFNCCIRNFDWITFKYESTIPVLIQMVQQDLEIAKVNKTDENHQPAPAPF